MPLLVEDLGGVENGDFSQQPGDPSLPIDNATNPLPGWSFVQSVGTGTITAFWVADPTLGSGGYVQFVATAAAVLDEAYLEQVVRITGNTGADSQFVHYSIFSAKHASADQLLYSQYVDAAGATVGAVGLTATVSTPTTPTPAVPNTDGIVPLLAQGNRIQLHAEVNAGAPLTAGLCTYRAVYIFRGQVATYTTQGASLYTQLDLPETGAVAPASGHGRFRAGTDSHPHYYSDGSVDYDLTGANAIALTANPAWAAKGDLIVGTGNDTAAILTVGANDTVHLADSAQATGTKWGTVPTAGITDAAVTLAKMANLAQDLFIGRVTGSTGVPETATITAAARTVLDDTTVGAMVDTIGGASATGTGGLVRLASPTFTGTVIVANITITGAVVRSGVISPTQLVANTDNWNPSGTGAYAWRVSTDASRNLTGIVAEAAGTEHLIMNIGAAPLVFMQNVTSTAGNRFLCPGNVNYSLDAGDALVIWYDTTSSRWRLIEA